MSETCTSITAERLKKLEELESQLPQLLEEARMEGLTDYKDYVNHVIRDKEAHAREELARYYRNRDAINARRRAARLAKKTIEADKKMV